MATYIVTEEDTDDEFATGIILGKTDAPNPETALYKVCRNMVDDDIFEMDGDFTETSIINMAMWVIGQARDDMEQDEPRELKVYRVANEYSQNELQVDVNYE